MELMWLVYAVENLTYGGSFWGATFGWLLIVTAVLLVVEVGTEVLNNNQVPKVIRRFTHRPLEEGDTFTLEKGFKGLSPDIEYQITDIYVNIDKFCVKGWAVL